MEIPEHIHDLQGLLTYVDSTKDGFRPMEMESAIRVVLQRIPGQPVDGQHDWYNEVAASSMMLLQEDAGPWGMAYGPIMEGTDAAGNPVTHPSLDRLDAETISYWRRRSRTSQNPLLKGIYGDLAWVFSKTFKVKSDPEDARIAIDSFAEFTSYFPADHHVYAIQYGMRAMTLAVLLNDGPRQQWVKLCLFDLAKRLEGDPSPLFRSFLMDAFGLGRFPKVALSDPERDYMINLLEEILEKERQTDSPRKPNTIWDAEHAAHLLLAYYKRIENLPEVNRILELLGEVIYQRMEDSEGMAGQAWLESYSRLCQDHGRRDLATKAIQAIQALGPKVVASLKRIGTTVDIPEAYFAQFTGQDLPISLQLLASSMVPKWDTVVSATEENARQFPFRFLIPTTLLDGMGRPTVEIPTLKANRDGYMPFAFSEHMNFESIPRFQVIEAIKEKFHPTAEEIADWLQRSPAFQPERRQLLVHGLQAYLNDDHITAIHVLVPQVEEAARVTAGCLGESTFNWNTGPNGIRSLDARSLNVILDSPKILEFFGQNHTTFLRVALVLNQGINLRNRMAHGLLLPDQCTRQASDMVFQCLLILGLVAAKSA